MRTTTNLPDELYGDVRRRAADEGRTVTSFWWAIFRDLCSKVSARGPLVADAAHAATAIEAGATWVTFDRGFARFPGLRWQVPTAV